MMFNGIVLRCTALKVIDDAVHYIIYRDVDETDGGYQAK